MWQCGNVAMLICYNDFEIIQDPVIFRLITYYFTKLYLKMKTSNNPLLDHTFNFSLDIINYCELLESERKYVIARQLLKSGTSIGANAYEAQSPESKADFIHKLKLADKEVRETTYWLLLCEKAPTYPKDTSLLLRLKEIEKILSSIISNAKKEH